jgi:hypothetical protein
MEKTLPANEIVQFSPGHLVDTLSSLYRTNPTVISYNTLYGVSPQEYEPLIKELQNVFDTKTESWNVLDQACLKYKIHALIIRDIDPLWENVNQLKLSREPLIINSYFAVFPCGE